MLALPEPYGYGGGHHISLRCNTRIIDSGKVKTILETYGCYPPAVPKILSSLQHGGRYDCVLQAQWFANQHVFIIKELELQGVDLIVLWEMPNRKLKSLYEILDLEMRYGSGKYSWVAKILWEEMGEDDRPRRRY